MNFPSEPGRQPTLFLPCATCGQGYALRVEGREFQQFADCRPCLDKAARRNGYRDWNEVLNPRNAAVRGGR